MAGRVVYVLWTCGNQMSARRMSALQSIRDNIRADVVLVTPDNINSYIVPGHPLHPCYGLLSAVHKADYLRCYLMHFHGGGYCDIKPVGRDNTFDAAFDLIDSNKEVDIVGVRELPGGAAFATYNADPGRLARLVSCCFYVARSRSEFTQAWYDKVTDYMDLMSYLLERYPAIDGSPAAGYPIPYTWLLGFPFHHTCDALFKRRPCAVSRTLVSGWHGERYK